MKIGKYFTWLNLQGSSRGSSYYQNVQHSVFLERKYFKPATIFSNMNFLSVLFVNKNVPDSLRNWKFLGVRKRMPFLQRMGGRRRSLDPIGGNRQWAGRGSRHCSKPHTVLSPSSSSKRSTRVEICKEYQE